MFKVHRKAKKYYPCKIKINTMWIFECIASIFKFLSLVFFYCFIFMLIQSGLNFKENNFKKPVINFTYKVF